MDAIIERMKGKKCKVLGEAFSYSIDLNNYLIGQGIDSSCQTDRFQIGDYEQKENGQA
jgi:hypothetical protein